ncbi:MAG: 4-hydroxy-tetrahydrodipicolinate synthase [Bacteroidota bacterium]|nr:4-hydroxy-tetrahydrodipicolinate synthase [Bacteroidota bacterium]
MRTDFSGAGVALVTPFNTDGTVDYTALEQLINYQIENGTDYLVILGTTAETATLSPLERKQVIDFIKEKNRKRLPLVLGIGGYNTAEVIETVAQTDLEGISAILSVVPYYSKPTQEGIYLHFMAIAQASPVPIMLYNVPGRTGTNMTAETTLRLAHASNKFIGIKEASGVMIQMSKIIKDKPADFQVISGDDALAVPAIAIGGAGVISVVCNALPRQLSTMVHAAQKGDYALASSLHLKLIDFTQNMFLENNPGGVKAALHALGLIKNELRLPLCPVSQELYNEIARETNLLIKE